MSLDPKQQHDIEQAAAGLIELGRAYAALYRELIEGGVPAVHALEIVLEVVRGNRP